MCFSANASFGASGLLTICGIYFHKSKNIRQNHILLASIPLIFAVHQFSEGLVWTGLTSELSDNYFNYATWFYLIISHLFWPVYMPLVMISYNKKTDYKKVNSLLLLLGLLVSSYISYWMIVSPNITPAIESCGRSIEYYFYVPYNKITELLYLLSVTAPFYFTKDRHLRWVVGPAWALTFIIAKFISGINTFPSVWCFLAAFASLVIYTALEPKAK